MRVIVPATHLPNEVWEALYLSGYDYEVHWMDDGEGYFWLLSGLWEAGETFAIVEHDIVVGKDTLRALEECPHPWCAYPYNYGGGFYPGLGCTKFSAECIAENPGAMAQVAWRSTEGANDIHPPLHWCTLDTYIGHVLGARHVHDEPVRHIGGEQPTHGCVTFA